MLRATLLRGALAVLLFAGGVSAQSPPVEIVAAGPQYDTGWLHRIFFGDHYRELWATPIPAEVLDLDRFAGGLTVLERGGGQQTKSLRFRGADDRQYQFRSIDKDPSAALPPALRQTAVRGIVRDQTSAGHPAGALIVPPILRAVGVLHASPRVFLLPESHPRLGEFAAEFGGMLGTIEVRPTDGDEDTEGFANASDVINTEDLLKVTEDSPDDQVDARAFLEARLVDLFLGDWDRHADQWRWARFGDARPRRWMPIPRDRDQAFVRFDGLLLTVARSASPQFVNFGPEYPGMLGLTWNGRDLDRRFLVGLEWPAWDSIAGELTKQLTDSVIEQAAAQMPRPYLPLDSARLADALKARRDDLPEAARRFYRHLAGEVEIHASDLEDLAVVDRIDDRFAELSLSLRGEDSTEPYLRRRFDARETKELRLVLHGDDDLVIVRGPGGDAIRVRVLPGKGTDAVADSSGTGAVHLYSTEPEDTTVPGGEVEVSRRPYAPADTAIRDWGTRWLSQLWLGAGPDVGAFLGGGVSHTRYGFRQDPYAVRYVLRAGYATGASTGRAEFTADWRRPNSEVRFGLHARASGIEVLRFHGFGNEVPAEGEDEFFRVNQVDLMLAPSVTLPLGRRLDLRMGPLLRYSDTDFDEPRFIALTRPYGSGAFGMLGAESELVLDARNRPTGATRGGYVRLSGSYYPGVLDVEEDFGSLRVDGITYLGSDSLPLRPVLALRAGGTRVWGRFPYQQAAFIGDPSTVRLGRQNRYAGEAAVWAGAELRLRISEFFLLVPGDFGVFGLGDVGRVYLDGESSDRWHGAAGGGIWASFIDPAYTVSLAVARSEERTGVYVGAGFGF